VRALIALLAAVQLVAAPPASAEVRRALLSVENLKLPAHATIRAFHIETWGVEFVAVCHMPPSWALKSEKFEDPEGSLDGRADTGGEPLKRLTDFYLVDIYDYQPLPKGDPKGEYHPPSFAGWVEAGTAEPFGGGARRKRALTANNFRLRDSRNCPVAPSPQP
jgi:hypothetical protein